MRVYAVKYTRSTACSVGTTENINTETIFTTDYAITWKVIPC